MKVSEQGWFERISSTIFRKAQSSAIHFRPCTWAVYLMMSGYHYLLYVTLNKAAI